MKRERLYAVVVGLLVVAGCGSAEAAQVHSQMTHQIRMIGPRCPAEYKTLATAVDAYLALTGDPPPSESALVTAQLMREEVAGFDLIRDDAGDGYELRPVGTCLGFDANTHADPPTPSPEFDMDCDSQRKVFEVAWEAFNAEYGTPPTSETDLVPELMRVESIGYDLVGTEIVAVPGVCD